MCEPANKRTAPASPRAAGWYSICAMQLPRRKYGLLLRQLYLPDLQLAYGSKCNFKASRRADQLRHASLGVTKVLYSREGQWVRRLCLLSTAVRTYEGMLEARDCKRLRNDRCCATVQITSPKLQKVLPWRGEAFREPQYPEDVVDRTE